MIKSSTWTEVRHLLWLQMRLMRSSLRRGSGQDVLRIVGVGLLLLMMAPGILAFNGLLVWVYRSLDPLAAAEIVAIIFSFLILSLLLTPVSNTQLVEPFALPRLFSHPVSLPGLIVGGLAVNLFSAGLLISAPFCIAIVAGLPRNLAGAPLVLISSLLFLAALVIIKALLDDVFDLIAEDRRLRMLAIFIALLPIVAIYGGQLYFQTGFIEMGEEPSLAINSVAELNQVITDLNLSRFLIWQPGGWIGRAAGAAAAGAYGPWLGWTALLLGFVVVGYAAHYAMLRRLYFGELVRVQVKQRTSANRLRSSPLRLPGLSPQVSEALWGLLRADLQSFIRNPYTVRMAIAPVILGLMAVFFSKSMPGPAVGIAALTGMVTVFVLTMTYGHNIFGILDNPGLATVLMAPVRPQLLLVSHNLLLTALVLALSGFVGLLIAILNGDWLSLPVALAAALALQAPTLGVCNLTSVYLPYKMDLEKGRAAANESRTSVIGVFAVMGGMVALAAPAAALVVAPLLLSPAALPLGILGAALYLAALYAALFYWAGRALASRGEQILGAISEGR